MKKSTLMATIAFISLSMFAVTAQAQVPCGGGIVGIGPFGIGVVVDCPPPVVVVRPRIVRRVVHRRPRVVIVERRGGCHRPHGAPCDRRPAPRYRRPVRRRAPVVAAPVVAAPRALNAAPAMGFSRLSIGAHIDSSSYEDGGLVGSGVNVKYMLTRRIGIEASGAVLSSCTNCNEYASRTDGRFGIAGLWYLGGKKDTGFNLFLKGGLMFNSITYNNDISGESMDVQQTNVELGGGIELKLSRSFGLYAEMTGMVASDEDDAIGTGVIPESMAKGIPSSANNNSAFNFKAGISWHF